MTRPPSVIILVADGVRPDTLDAAVRAGAVPALARLRDEGAMYTVTSVFPSVTGPAYAPFLTGRHPGSVGLPGLRWYDRSRATCGWPSYARSYVGAEMRHVDRDLAADVPTMFELAPSSLGALNVIGRGLGRAARIGQGAGAAVRTAFTHFRGDLQGWLRIDRAVGDTVVRRIRDERPAFTFAAFTGVDKASHAAGHESPVVVDALRIVDDVVARLRDDAERAGVWEETHVWIVSDHGHSPVAWHDDLADVLRTRGHRVLAHPRVFTREPDVAVMVSGNAMAHLYVELGARTRPFWPALAPRWGGFAEALLARESVDLVVLPTSPESCEVRARARGSAAVEWRDGRYTYEPRNGDPLGIGSDAVRGVSADEAYDATISTDYPDALVQLAALCSCERAGDVILSAARAWDFRGKYEPIPHVSSHGALHRDHMLVPVLVSRPLAAPPLRTIDVMPAALDVLGLDIPASLIEPPVLR